MRIYSDLADWYYLLTAADEYGEEAESFGKEIREAVPEAKTLLELGCGGGNLASHLKTSLGCTLTDLSPQMVSLSRGLNPECAHAVGDMRSLRLGATFDVVLAHDAVCYMTAEHDLAAAMRTAWEHCRPGGVAIFAPDWVRETFEERTDTGGRDGDGRALRYLEWCYDPDPADTVYSVEYALLLREGTDPARVEHDHHLEGIFSRERWIALLEETGFQVRRVSFGPGAQLDVFVARR